MRIKSIRRFLRIMRNHPQRLVRRARRYESSRVRLQGRALWRWIARYQHRPLSMLSECYGNQCPNSRLKHPEIRQRFVQEVIRLVQQEWGKSLEQLRCIILGSGGLLQESILLSQLCEAIMVKSLHVVLCDKEYIATDFIKNSQQTQDCVTILQARFQQITSWMDHTVPQTSWQWTITHSWESAAALISDQPTLLVAADVEMTDELWENLHVLSRNSLQAVSLLIVVLDHQGVLHVIENGICNAYGDELKSVLH